MTGLRKELLLEKVLEDALEDWERVSGGQHDRCGGTEDQGRGGCTDPDCGAPGWVVEARSLLK